MSIVQHPVFEKFDCWEGVLGDGFLGDFLGVKTRKSFFKLLPEQTTTDGILRPALPPVDEEYYEWIDLLEAVLSARETFTMIELGGGWGRWLVRAAFAAKSFPGLRCKLIGVEAEPTHFAWMKQHFTENGLDPAEHTLIEAAISDKAGDVWFYTGSPDDWYGQCIYGLVTWRDRLRQLFQGKQEKIINNQVLTRMRTVTLKSLLDAEPRVDLIDLDVQGSEYIVLKSASKELSKKVKRVHIGTHCSEIEASLRQLFRQMEWNNISDFPCRGESETPFGPIKFDEGIQTWVNPRMAS